MYQNDNKFQFFVEMGLDGYKYYRELEKICEYYLKKQGAVPVKDIDDNLMKEVQHETKDVQHKTKDDQHKTKDVQEKIPKDVQHIGTDNAALASATPDVLSGLIAKELAKQLASVGKVELPTDNISTKVIKKNSAVKLVRLIWKLAPCDFLKKYKEFRCSKIQWIGVHTKFESYYAKKVRGNNKSNWKLLLTGVCKWIIGPRRGMLYIHISLYSNLNKYRAQGG